MAEVAKEQAGRRNAEAAKAALALELELEQMKAQNRLVEEENRVLKEENRALQEQMTRMEEEHRLMWEAIKRIEEEGESRGAVGTEPETRVADEPKPDTCEAYESIPQPKVETCAGDI